MSSQLASVGKVPSSVHTNVFFCWFWTWLLNSLCVFLGRCLQCALPPQCASYSGKGDHRYKRNLSFACRLCLCCAFWGEMDLVYYDAFQEVKRMLVFARSMMLSCFVCVVIYASRHAILTLAWTARCKNSACCCWLAAGIHGDTRLSATVITLLQGYTALHANSKAIAKIAITSSLGA